MLCRDCIFPLNIRETRIRVCVQAIKEWFQSTVWTSEYSSKFGPNPNEVPLLIFYECMIALNVETISEEFKDKEIRRSGKSFSRDYEMLTVEICFLGNIYKILCFTFLELLSEQKIIGSLKFRLANFHDFS